MVSTERATVPAGAADPVPASWRGRLRRHWRMAAVVTVLAVLGVELVAGWPALAAAFTQFRTPHPG